MPTRKQLADETRRIKKLEKQGYDAKYIKSWLRGWRQIDKVK